MDATRDNSAGVAAPPAEVYCRRCGYSLRGLTGGKCPECAGAFDLANHKTFARRPPRVRLKRWARRVALVIVLLALAAASVPGWYWWQWHKERRVVDQLRALGARVEIGRSPLTGLAERFPAQWAFPRERAVSLRLITCTPEQFEQIDLARLDHLTSVQIWSGCVDDAVLARFRRFSGLRYLHLYGNPLDGSGLAHLSGCRQLLELDLAMTRMTDASMSNLRGMTSLKDLRLNGTRVTDLGLIHLRGLRALEFIGLRDTAVTDAGLLHLRGLTLLRRLDVGGTGVSESAVRALRVALPGVSVER